MRALSPLTSHPPFSDLPSPSHPSSDCPLSPLPPFFSYENHRVERVTIPLLKDQGIIGFCFVAPGETFEGFLPHAHLVAPYGGFFYFYDDDQRVVEWPDAPSGHARRSDVVCKLVPEATVEAATKEGRGAAARVEAREVAATAVAKAASGTGVARAVAVTVVVAKAEEKSPPDDAAAMAAEDGEALDPRRLVDVLERPSAPSTWCQRVCPMASLLCAGVATLWKRVLGCPGWCWAKVVRELLLERLVACCQPDAARRTMEMRAAALALLQRPHARKLTVRAWRPTRVR